MLSLLGLPFQNAECACSMQANGHNACVLDFVPCFSRADCCLQQVERLSRHQELVEPAIGFQQWNCSSGIILDGKEETLSSLFFFSPFFFKIQHTCLFWHSRSQIRRGGEAKHMYKIKPVSKDTKVSKKAAYVDFRRVLKVAWKLADVFWISNMGRVIFFKDCQRNRGLQLKDLLALLGRLAQPARSLYWNLT